MLQLHVCSEKLALREWCTLKKVARLENFFTPSCMWTKCNMFFLELLPFSVRHFHFRKVGRGGGHLQVLKKIYRLHVIFKVLGPPCQCQQWLWQSYCEKIIFTIHLLLPIFWYWHIEFFHNTFVKVIVKVILHNKRTMRLSNHSSAYIIT